MGVKCTIAIHGYTVEVTGVYNVSNQLIRDLGLILAGNRSPIGD